MKTDEPFDLVNVDRFAARAVAVHAHRAPHSVEQFGRFRGGRGGVWQLVAFLARLPSRRQEIYDKLPYNSR
jgi:hypothetical protein